MRAEIVAVCIICVAGMYLLAYSLCVVAARADRRIEEMMEAARVAEQGERKHGQT
jgi:hypothetical protein